MSSFQITMFNAMFIIFFIIVSETFVKFVVAESKLEIYLSENPPNESNIADAQKKLEEAQKQLNQVLHSTPPVSFMKHCMK